MIFSRKATRLILEEMMQWVVMVFFTGVDLEGFSFNAGDFNIDRKTQRLILIAGRGGRMTTEEFQVEDFRPSVDSICTLYE